MSCWLTSKIDYGPIYEKVRVRKGYSPTSRKRVTSELMKKTIVDDDNDTVAEISHFSASDVHDGLSFLEQLFSKNWSTSSQSKLQRALIVALALNARVKAILREFDGVDLKGDITFCDNGFTEMEHKKIVSRAKNVVKAARHQWEDKETLKKSVLSMELLSAVLAECLEIAASDLGTLTASEIWDRIGAL